MAIVLAMDAIARERSTGTLSFLLDKPIAGATVLTDQVLVRAWRVVVGRANGLGDGVSWDVASLEVGQREYIGI